MSELDLEGHKKNYQKTNRKVMSELDFEGHKRGGKIFMLF